MSDSKEEQSTMQAVVTGTWRTMARIGSVLGRKSAGDASVKEVPIPVPTAEQLLVEVTTVALNPTDFKHIDVVSPNNAVIGCDYSGVVKAVGSGVKNWAVGDRAAGVVHGGLYHDQGSFAQYLVVDATVAFKVPEHINDMEAPTYGVSAVTAMQALNHNLGVPWADEAPAADKPTILIYAGSSTNGLYAIQVGALAGYTVVTTCSPHNFDLVKSYGAAAAFDYRSPTALADIKKEFPDIKVALDGFSEAASTDFCCKAMGKDGGKVIHLLNQGKSTVKGVEVQNILAYTLTGKAFSWFGLMHFPAVPADRLALERFYAMLPGLAGKSLRAPPTQLVGTGFPAIFEGLELLRQGKVSGKKLIVSLKAADCKVTAEKEKA